MPFDHFPDGIVVADADGRVTYVNRWIKYWARAEGDELLGMHLNDTLPFDDLGGNSWFDCVHPYDGLNIRTRISESSWYSPRGSEYLITASLVRDQPAGKVMKVIVSIRNARVRLQRDREKSDMVATVAHELRSPLTGIKGFSATLLSRWDAFTEDQRVFMLQTIDADADRLSRLITELLDAARIDAGRLSLRTEPVRLDELTERVLASVFSTADEPPLPRVTAEVPIVWGDADRITQVFTNLLENAMRHGEGLREIVVGPEDRDGAAGVSVRVIDNGPGIAPESRMRIFSRFWRSGPGAGSGLGMFIVRGVVDQHGGTITIDDAEGGGASIGVWLPVNEPDTMTS
ncbi:ATP-binding protein [Aeromicrobium sp.]|uniref:sensor histidine kinase n=1 Tax=Aeromicrobium sp. TaxID=1871063 RepID=UPI0028AD1F9E|nr:ATP-binding protein [Aeromicrobium sp.]